MNRLTRSAMLFTVLSVVLSLICAASLSAQSRLSDKDVQQHMKNLKDDAKKFRSGFNSALSKSTIRKTTQEKDAKTLAQNFEKQTNSMYETFKKSTKAEPYLQNCLDTARQIDKIMTSTPLDSTTSTQWSTVKTEINTLANAFNVPGV
jgi:hypothetical protein